MTAMDFGKILDAEITAAGIAPVTTAQIKQVVSNATAFLNRTRHANQEPGTRAPRYVVFVTLTGEYAVVDSLADQIVATFYDLVTYHECGQAIPVLVGQFNADKYASDRNKEAGQC